MAPKVRFDSSEIGFAAGNIWTFLKDNQNGVTVNKLCKELDQPKKTVHAAIGWLAREGKIEFREEKKKTFIYTC